MRKSILPLLLLSCFNPTGSSQTGTEGSSSSSSPTPDSDSETTSGTTGGGTTVTETTGPGPTSEALTSEEAPTTSGSEGSSGMESTGQTVSGLPPAVCGNGMIEEGEECEGPAPRCEDCKVTTRYVFVSSITLGGNALGGLEGADATCMSLAQGKPVIGDKNFVAWLSDARSSAQSRIGDSKVPYKLPDDATLVASSTEDLLDGTLVSSISKDETATVVLGSFDVWTGTTPSGDTTPGQHCSSWGAEGQTGYIGQLVAADGAWTADSILACSQAARLYCIEQAP